MDTTTIARRMAKLEYAAVRLPLALFEDRVVARCWEENAIVRVGFERFLGSMDWFAGRLLADDAISARGRALMRRTGRQAREAEAWDAWEQAQPWHAPEQEGAGPAPEQEGARPAPEQEGAAPAPEQEGARPAPEQEGARPAGDHAAGRPDTSARPAARPGTVDVPFSLPAEVSADTVALCGDFNDWSPGAIILERGGDGAWGVTVALEPGGSYRYRYLLDGRRWENAWHADRYVPNSYGSVDSVVVVE